MKKITFYKLFCDISNGKRSVKQAIGYLFQCPLDVSIALEKHPFGFWTATELKTGLLVVEHADTRASAIEESCLRAPIVHKLLKNPTTDIKEALNTIATISA